VIVDTMGLLLVVAVTSASVQDRAGGRTVLARLAAAFRTVSLVWADGGYANSVASTLLSWARDALGIVVEILTSSPSFRTGRMSMLYCNQRGVERGMVRVRRRLPRGA
jgi:hypothetical protein